MKVEFSGTWLAGGCEDLQETAAEASRCRKPSMILSDHSHMGLAEPFPSREVSDEEAEAQKG